MTCFYNISQLTYVDIYLRKPCQPVPCFRLTIHNKLKTIQAFFVMFCFVFLESGSRVADWMNTHIMKKKSCQPLL